MMYFDWISHVLISNRQTISFLQEEQKYEAIEKEAERAAAKAKEEEAELKVCLQYAIRMQRGMQSLIPLTSILFKSRLLRKPKPRLSKKPKPTARYVFVSTLSHMLLQFIHLLTLGYRFLSFRKIRNRNRTTVSKQRYAMLLSSL